MTKVHGYTECSSSEIKNLCEAYLLDREERLQKRIEEFIEYEMNKKWFKAKTREEALKRRYEDFGFDRCSIGGAYWEYRIEEIRASCNFGDTILISSDILSVLNIFKEKTND